MPVWICAVVGAGVAKALPGVLATAVALTSPVVFASVSANHVVVATFAINAYTVTASVSGGNGSVAVINPAPNYGDTATVTVTPNAGYHIATLTDNGNPIALTSSVGVSLSASMPASASYTRFCRWSASRLFRAAQSRITAFEIKSCGCSVQKPMLHPTAEFFRRAA